MNVCQKIWNVRVTATDTTQVVWNTLERLRAQQTVQFVWNVLFKAVVLPSIDIKNVIIKVFTVAENEDIK